jgi:hypothetical protein
MRAGRDAVMVRERHGIRHADEKRRQKILSGVMIDGDDGGGRVAVDETGEQGEIAVPAAGQGLEGFPVYEGDMRSHHCTPWMGRAAGKAALRVKV